MAHITMLESVGLLGSDELPVLLDGLRELLVLVDDGGFVIEICDFTKMGRFTTILWHSIQVL